MKDFEVSYTAQQLPPMVKKRYFVVFVECGMSTYVKEKIFTDYDEATTSKESSGGGVSNSFVSGFDSKQEAQERIKRYKKW